MQIPRRLSNAEIAEIRRRRPSVRASLAVEGMYLSAKENQFIEQMHKERLGGEDRISRAIQFDRERRRPADRQIDPLDNEQA